jgi:hydroxypyruvate reductase
MTAPDRHRLLVIGALPAELRRALEGAHDLIEKAALPAGLAPGFDVAVTTSMDGATASLMADLPDLKLIACNGAGLERIDLIEARRRNIEIFNTPDAVTRDTADFAIAMIFAIARRLVESDRFMRSGAWANAKMAPSSRVSGKRLGIVGLGKIGSAIASRAAALGLEVGYNARGPKPELPYRFVASVAELAGQSDFLILSCPGGEETRGLVSAEVLRRLGPKGFLINISRGSVVDEAALLDALEAKTIAGAALDVFENEPRIDARFLTLENVVLTPHVAAVTQETRDDIAELLRARIAAFLETSR